MAMVGHKTESIYRRYAIADEVMLREGAEKLAALHQANADAPRKIVRFSGREDLADQVWGQNANQQSISKVRAKLAPSPRLQSATGKRKTLILQDLFVGAGGGT